MSLGLWNLWKTLRQSLSVEMFLITVALLMWIVLLILRKLFLLVQEYRYLRGGPSSHFSTIPPLLGGYIWQNQRVTPSLVVALLMALVDKRIVSVREKDGGVFELQLEQIPSDLTHEEEIAIGTLFGPVPREGDSILLKEAEHLSNEHYQRWRALVDKLEEELDKKSGEYFSSPACLSAGLLLIFFFWMQALWGMASGILNFFLSFFFSLSFFLFSIAFLMKLEEWVSAAVIGQPYSKSSKSDWKSIIFLLLASMFIGGILVADGLAHQVVVLAVISFGGGATLLSLGGQFNLTQKGWEVYQRLYHFYLFLQGQGRTLLPETRRSTGDGKTHLFLLALAMGAEEEWFHRLYRLREEGGLSEPLEKFLAPLEKAVEKVQYIKKLIKDIKSSFRIEYEEGEE